MQLLLAVINEPEKVDDIIAGFFEIGLRGATVIPSEGMGRILSHDIPVFAGLQTLLQGSRPQNRTIFSVVDDDQVDPAMEVLQRVCGTMDSPATGIAVTLPLGRVVGLAPRHATPEKGMDSDSTNDGADEEGAEETHPGRNAGEA
jgi:nitrogen regulatory protein P-II 1